MSKPKRKVAPPPVNRLHAFRSPEWKPRLPLDIKRSSFSSNPLVRERRTHEELEKLAVAYAVWKAKRDGLVLDRFTKRERVIYETHPEIGRYAVAVAFVHGPAELRVELHRLPLHYPIHRIYTPDEPALMKPGRDFPLCIS